MSISKYKKIIKEKMSEKRYIHSVNVAKQAVKLAKMYNADVKKCEIAGVLHDITKEMPFDEQLKLIDNSDIILTDLERKTNKLWHSISGSVYVKDILKIEDEEIINAIKYHTTGRSNMTLVEKIIFVADFISDERVYDDVVILRELAYESLEDAMLYGLSFTIKDLIDRQATVEPNTISLYNELILNNNKEIK